MLFKIIHVHMEFQKHSFPFLLIRNTSYTCFIIILLRIIGVLWGFAFRGLIILFERHVVNLLLFYFRILFLYLVVVLVCLFIHLFVCSVVFHFLLFYHEVNWTRWHQKIHFWIRLLLYSEIYIHSVFKKIGMHINWVSIDANGN